jgi:hypothetical protein
VRASAAPPPPLPHRSHARPPSPALAGEASQAALAAAADKLVDNFKLKPGSITGATIMSCGGEAAISKRLSAAAADAERLAVVNALVAETAAAAVARGECARGKACARRRRVRATAAPPPPLPHRSHARPPSPALAGEASTDVSKLKTCKLENPESFAQLEELLLEVGVAAVRDGDSATLTGVTTANACDVQAAMDMVGAKFTGLTTRGAFARGRACARRRRVRASAAPPPPLPHRSHARPPSPALAGEASTDVNELKTCKLENPESFADFEALLKKIEGASAVRDGTSATLMGVTTANAAAIKAAMAEVGATATGLATRGAFARQGVRAPPPCARYRLLQWRQRGGGKRGRPERRQAAYGRVLGSFLRRRRRRACPLFLAFSAFFARRQHEGHWPGRAHLRG